MWLSPKYRQNPLTLAILSVLAGWLCLLGANGGCSVLEEAVRPAPLPLERGEHENGRFERVRGVGVLTLWGSPRERGVAHGYLMAPAILDLVDVIGATKLLLSDLGDYEKKILPMQSLFLFSEEEEAELRGILDGVEQRYHGKAPLRALGRSLTLEDLKAINTAGDWYRQACASFCAWGSAAQEGHVWVGRNFDFLPARAFFSHQMILVNKRRGECRAWCTVTAPGLIGCITGLNEKGVFASVHDVFLPLRPLTEGYTPRILAMRHIVSSCDARDLRAQVLPILETRLQMFDNSIMVAAPVKDGTSPAFVFEINGDRSKDRGVTVRAFSDNEDGLSPEMITCTNHFRKRVLPTSNLTHYRYPLMRRVLMAKTGRGQKVGFDVARKTMGAVRLPITVHTVIVDLDTLDYWFASGAFLSPPGNRDYVELPVASWLRSP
ncbi:MAG: C45 family autoproteolytic acyltransferase/hydrolase [Planctomycetota bacterium]|jgi:hypothetical protein